MFHHVITLSHIEPNDPELVEVVESPNLTTSLENVRGNAHAFRPGEMKDRH